MSSPKSPSYVGPTSPEFGLLSRNEPRDEGDFNDVIAHGPAGNVTVNAAADSLHNMGQAEAARLVEVYGNTVGVMYPCVDLDSVQAYVADFYKTAHPISPATTNQDWFFARDVEVLKIILATALLAESHGRSERAAQLADSVEDKFASRLKIAEVDMKELLILTLLVSRIQLKSPFKRLTTQSIFHSYRDDEVIAWRLIGIAARGSIELGLHCQDTWRQTGGVFPGELQWKWASRLFWCIYVLDRKWSFGTGLPFALQDSDMDTNLPEPGAATPYLTCMISYARLSTKIWNLVMGWKGRSRASTSDYGSYLDFQIQQWTQSIPKELRLDSSWSSQNQPRVDDNSIMLQVLLALQANQLRILVYRQILLNSASIEADVSGASAVVEAAKDTVQTLKSLTRVSDIYFQRPEPFNYFLISSLAALFLAVLHAPARFSQECRPEFYTAVELVKRSSTRARTSRRLQKIIRSLNSIRHQSGLGINRSPKHSPDVALNGHAVREVPSQPLAFTPMSNPSHRSPQQSTPASSTPPPSSALWTGSPDTVSGLGHGNCDDLTSFFEMAGGLYFDPIGIETQENTRHIHGSEGFNADDETLTRAMAGLL